MTLEIIAQIILFGIALAMDAFAVSIVDGLTYVDINKKKAFFIAITFGVMQALMPLIGYWALAAVKSAVGVERSVEVAHTMSTVVTWVSFGLLVLIGGKMIIEAIIELRKPVEEKEPTKFSIKEVLLMGVATAIDAFAVGVSLQAGLSDNVTIWLHVSIIMVITFGISLLGVFAGHFFEKLFKGHYEISSIVGGTILILLAVWIVLSHYLGI